MNGIELASEYFNEYGRPMLEEQFPEVLPCLAAGMIGSGSECFGYDDEVSRDHDWEPGFCLFLPDEDAVDRRTAFQLERAYAKLPKEFRGFRRSLMQPVGGARRGVIRLNEFLQDRLGTQDSELTLQQWLALPSQALAEVTNGVVFFDNLGALTEVREALAFYPEDVRRKKLAGHLLLMAQSGQYNYMRCIEHGERAAAQLAIGEFVRHAMSAVFLLAKKYEPYYKWSFRALRELPGRAEMAENLSYLLTTDNSDDMYDGKYYLIEEIASDVIGELIDQDLTRANCGDLEKHAYSVNDLVEDGALRNLHVLAAV